MKNWGGNSFLEGGRILHVGLPPCVITLCTFNVHGQNKLVFILCLPNVNIKATTKNITSTDSINSWPQKTAFHQFTHTNLTKDQ